MSSGLRDKARPRKRYGRPIRMVVSAAIALPFIVVGVYSLNQPGLPLWAATVVLVVGVAMLAIGQYMSLGVSYPSPSLAESGEEKVVMMRHPTMKPAYARIILSIPFIIIAVYLYAFTLHPYVYPFALSLAGIFLFFSGAQRYWVNLRTTYYVTNRRVTQMYRFIWLETKEIPVSRIISISESRGFFEVLTGRGNVTVSSGVGSRRTIRIQDIDNPGPMADAIRGLVP
jgi:uncharacterized membrane protein YdbT with pleckstrin-like domain